MRLSMNKAGSLGSALCAVSVCALATSAQATCRSGEAILDPSLTPVRAINIGGPAFSAPSGIVFDANDPSVMTRGGTHGDSNATYDVLNTEDDTVYKARGHSRVTIEQPVANGCHRVSLHFMESTSNGSAVGQRLMDIEIEGERLLEELDVFAETGAWRTALVKTFDVEVQDNVLTVDVLRSPTSQMAPHVAALSIFGSPPETAERRPFAGVWAPYFQPTTPLFLSYSRPDFADGYQEYMSGTTLQINWDDFVTYSNGEFLFDNAQLFSALNARFDQDTNNPGSGIDNTDGKMIFVRLWAGHASPPEIFDGTAKVDGQSIYTFNTDATQLGNAFARDPNACGTDPDPHPLDCEVMWPDYADPNYRTLLAEFLADLGAALDGLPADKKARLAFIQPGFGATGDQQLFKGNITQRAFPGAASTTDITDAEYLDFMTWATGVIETELIASGIDFLYNIRIDKDVPRPEEVAYKNWLLGRPMEPSLFKQQFTIAIGHEVPGDSNRPPEYFATAADGLPRYLRGEFAYREFGPGGGRAIPNTDNRFDEAVYMYWTSLSSTSRGLDGWQMDAYSRNWFATTGPLIDDTLGQERWDTDGYFRNEEYLSFSARYSSYKEPASSPVAFLAFRDILDPTDTTRFASAGLSGDGRNADHCRVGSDAKKLQALFAPYGATLDSCEAVGSPENVNYLDDLDGYNSVVRNVPPGNYQRFIYQVGIDEPVHDRDTADGYNTDLYQGGYWNVGVDFPYPPYGDVGDGTPGGDRGLPSGENCRGKGNAYGRDIPGSDDCPPGYQPYGQTAEGGNQTYLALTGSSLQRNKDWRPYGKYARGFDNQPANANPINQMDFQFHGSFNPHDLPVRIKVTWYDEYAGAGWKLRYAVPGGTKDLPEVVGTGSNTWKSTVFDISGHDFANAAVDFSFVNGTLNEDHKFHLIEAEIK